jgi:hypothetical protein
MTIPVAEPRPNRVEIVTRVTGILTRPEAEWPLIEQEPASIGSLFASYILPLSAIPAICGFVGSVLFGHTLLGITYRPSVLSALFTSLATYLLSLGGIFVMALIVNGLAPVFGGERNRVQALKVIAYSSTAVWIAGIISLLPDSGLLLKVLIWLIVAIYSLSSFRKGLPILMKSPKERTRTYAGCSIVAALIAGLLISPIQVAVLAFISPAASSGDTVGGTLKLGGIELDLDQMQKSAANMRQVEERLKSGEPGPPMLPAEALKQFLPASLPGGLAQRTVTSSGGQFNGFGEIDVQALYMSGQSQVTLTVSDLGASGSLATMAGALGITATQQEGTRSTKIDHAGGRTIAEGYDSRARNGAYSVILANRFRVPAEGSSVTIDDLRSAVNAVNLAKLEAMAQQR